MAPVTRLGFVYNTFSSKKIYNISPKCDFLYINFRKKVHSWYRNFHVGMSIDPN